jgi:thiamine kinase-like enzyme
MAAGKRIAVISHKDPSPDVLAAAKQHDPQLRRITNPQELQEFLQLGRRTSVIFAAKNSNELSELVNEFGKTFREEDCDTGIIWLTEETSAAWPDPRPCGNELLRRWVPMSEGGKGILSALDHFGTLPQRPACGNRVVQIAGEGWYEHRSLLRAAFRSSMGITVEPLKQGKSGAFVAIVRGTDCSGKALLPSVVKIRSERRLAQENARIGETTRLLPQGSYLPIREVVYDREKCLLVLDAVLGPSNKVTTLRSLYHEGPERVRLLLHKVLNTLSHWTKSAEQVNSFSLAQAYLGRVANDSKRKAALQKRLEELGLVREDFLTSLEKWATDAGLEAWIYSHGHGDLHGDNILLDSHEQPCLIDFSRASEDQPVALDFATLVLDILWLGMNREEASAVLEHVVLKTKATEGWAHALQQVAAEFCTIAKISARDFWAAVVLLAISNLSYEDIDRPEMLEAIASRGLQLLTQK